MLSISAIIPTLNEAHNIESLLHYLYRLDRHVEVIVADGNSSDDTATKAGRLATVIQAPRGRGAQMNAGARAVSGDILWFLHADCRPHARSIQAMRQALRNPAVVGGAFEYNLDPPGAFFRWVERLSNRKNHLLKLVYGDMGIFVRREPFDRMGGYEEIPLMEDMDFCRRLKRFGEIVILPQRIDTSARRWFEEGIAKNIVRNWLLQMGWAMGISPYVLDKYYKFR